MKKWLVKFEGSQPGPEGDFSIPFVDYLDVVDSAEAFNLTRNYMQEILSLIKTKDHYSELGNLKEILSPEGEDLIGKQVLALFGIYSRTGEDLKIGVLLAHYQDAKWGILGLYPEGFAYAVRNDLNILKAYLTAFVKTPNDWKRVDVVIPV